MKKIIINIYQKQKFGPEDDIFKLGMNFNYNNKLFVVCTQYLYNYNLMNLIHFIIITKLYFRYY